MLYHVRMDVRLPADLDPAVRDDLIAREKAYSQQLQRSGKWPHIWRIAGEYANFSVLDVACHDELHELLSALPLFPYMEIKVTPLARHPSKVD
ncbi:muconolactone Delta-isomerase [Amycolatopsis benzoatilytica]|uniref:muconolactone Delta-isomerase n=1 Tax=Amycolatopsis benzoatilytica TaxID=346045 RepID=UPI0003768298|nr:muconolactone Delta-isomerase [Amycolatopsis benzoatilytica]